MLILLSPAKNLDFKPAPMDAPRTQPVFAKQTARLAQIARKQSAKDLQRLMELSEGLAALNHQRFQDFDPNPPLELGKQAVLAFNGDVYQGLNAKSLSLADLDWAQNHLRILSGLYGLLRPLDAIQPYRLEMGVKLANPEGENLYDFWRPLLAAHLNAEKAETIINLASDEYFSAIDRKALNAEIISPTFKEIKDGKARPIFMFVKRARGLMARWIIENRVQDPAKLVKFNIGGYRFDEAASSAEQWVFTRPQPAPKRN